MSLTATIETPCLTYEQPIGLYIDGKWVQGKEGKTFETINPSNEKPIVAVHEAGPDGRDSLDQPLLAAVLSATDMGRQMSTSLLLPHEKLLTVCGPRPSHLYEATCS